MNITAEVEQRLWASAQASQIADIEGFPLPSHAALKAAVASGAAQLGVEFTAARNLAGISKSPGGAALIHGLSLVCPALAIGSIVIAFVTGNWWSLFGVVASFLGQILANPYIPARNLWKILVAAALLHVVTAASITSGLTWVSFAFAVSVISVRVLNGLAWRWAHDAAVSSEAFAAYLFRTRNLHIRDASGTMHDALTGPS
jgi:hypothetical protein